MFCDLVDPSELIIYSCLNWIGKNVMDTQNRYNNKNVKKIGLKQSSKRQNCLKQNLVTLLNLTTFKQLDASLKKSGKVGQDFK